MRVTVSGRFPIVSNGAHPLRSAVDAWRDRGTTTPASTASDPELTAAQAVAQRELVAAQEAAGVDLVGEGYLPIYDEWFAWSAAVDGVGDGGHIRYLDTNTYYHRWLLQGIPRRRGPSPLVAAYRRARELTDRPIKPGLFGPYTLWAYAVKPAPDPAAYDALVEIVAGEVADLAAAGARYVQIDESILLRPTQRGDFPRVARAVERIAAAAPEVSLIVHLACGRVDDLLGSLLEIPGLGGLGIDFTDAYREPNLKALQRLRTWPAGKILQAGLADARQVRIETEGDVHTLLATICRRVPAEQCLAAPSTALQYLPRHIALEKLSALARAAHSFSSVEVER